jgi:hypothetical protein
MAFASVFAVKHNEFKNSSSKISPGDDRSLYRSSLYSVRTKSLTAYSRGGRARFVVAGVSVGLKARVFPGEALAGFGMDDRAERLVLELAGPQAMCAPRYPRHFVAEGIVDANITVKSGVS